MRPMPQEPSQPSPGMPGMWGQAVTFGSWPLENHTTSPMIVTAISPTNVPAGLVV
jgi:hypothetical protein